MSQRIRSVMMVALAAGLAWSCGRERVLESSGSDDRIGRALSKVAAAGDGRASGALVEASVSRDGAPAAHVMVEFARSIAGRKPDYRWSGTTDAKGRVTVEISSPATGYFQARASQDGAVTGHWSSIPVNDGYRTLVALPVGGKARVARSSRIGVIAIGLVPHLSGVFSSPRPPMRNASEMALEEINNAHGEPRFEFIIEDSRSTIDGAVEAFKKLIHRDGVLAILGPRTSSQAVAAFPIAQENRVVALGPTSAARGISEMGDFLFRASLTVDRYVPGGIEKTREALGYKQVATIFDDADVFSRSSDEVIRNALTEGGVDIVTTETFQTADADVSAQLTRIKALNPDAVFISSQAVDMADILIQGRQVGIPSEVPFITSSVLTLDGIKRAGVAAEGVIAFTAWSSMADTPGNRAFVENYTARYGVEPNVIAAQSYASVYILTQAISDARSASGSETPESENIRDALRNIRNLDTILGQFSFDNVGDGIYSPTVLTVTNGSLVVFDPTPASVATAIIGETNDSGLSGKATFTQFGENIQLVVSLANASPGEHAVHIHAKGDCSAQDGTSAGGHWNPTGVAHGKWGEGEFHLGDIGNASVNDQGAGGIELTTNLWEIDTGSTIDIIGKAIVVHAGADDFVSQPSGNAGARIGCGVIVLDQQ